MHPIKVNDQQQWTDFLNTNLNLKKSEGNIQIDRLTFLKKTNKIVLFVSLIATPILIFLNASFIPSQYKPKLHRQYALGIPLAIIFLCVSILVVSKGILMPKFSAAYSKILDKEFDYRRLLRAWISPDSLFQKILKEFDTPDANLAIDFYQMKDAYDIYNLCSIHNGMKVDYDKFYLDKINELKKILNVPDREFFPTDKIKRMLKSIH